MTGDLSILVAGKPYPCSVPVHSMESTGLHFTARVRLETHFVVNHWTGSENPAESVFANLGEEKRSVHFVIDQLGEVYQFADTAARLAHAVENGGNSFGVGIEIINRGTALLRTRGIVRRTSSDFVHGRNVIYAEFLEPQISSAILLNMAICEAYGLPVRCPVKSDGTIYSTVLPPTYLANFRGVLGHCNLDAGKTDPAIELLRRIHAAGAAMSVG